MAASMESLRVCRSFSRLLIRLQSRSFVNCHRNITCSSCSRSKDEERMARRKRNPDGLMDPLPLFLNEDVQKLLRKITGFDIEKVHSSKASQSARKPQYKLLTDAELLEEQQQAIREAMAKLQMPPVMAIRDRTTKVLSLDPDIQPALDSKYVFIDIGESSNSRDRLITVRDTNGSLRTPTGKEQDRINEIYEPIPGRLLYPPRMFQDEYLTALLKERKYLYILDRACVQYEPDNEDYIRVCSSVYNHINTVAEFDALRSTRHFGPMAFHYCWAKKIPNLLVDMLSRDLISDSVDLIHLYYIIHNKPISAQAAGKEPLVILKEFCESSKSGVGQLELAIQAYEDSLQPKTQAQQESSS